MRSVFESENEVELEHIKQVLSEAAIVFEEQILPPAVAIQNAKGTGRLFVKDEDAEAALALIEQSLQHNAELLEEVEVIIPEGKAFVYGSFNEEEIKTVHSRLEAEGLSVYLLNSNKIVSLSVLSTLEGNIILLVDSEKEGHALRIMADIMEDIHLKAQGMAAGISPKDTSEPVIENKCPACGSLKIDKIFMSMFSDKKYFCHDCGENF